MKKKLKKWAFRFTTAVVFIISLLLIIVLNPILTYANKTVKGAHCIYHNQQLQPGFETRLSNANALVSKSEYYDSTLQLDICLADGSKYPYIIKCLRGNAFAWGFYNKVVLMGNANCKENYVELNGYRWNMEQLLAHEMVHCFQFVKRGFWNSNPVAGIPEWKWEGYPEYIARNNKEQQDLAKAIEHLLTVEKTDTNGWIEFSDGTGTVLPYYKSWLLVKYCMDVKHMTYTQILNDTTSEEAITEQMMKWYQQVK